MARGLKSFFRQLQIDTRLLGMVGALVVLWILFDLVTGGRFLTPRNLFNLSVQTASVAVMATGMVFVIVTRHIDLSVGSLLGLLGMIMGTLQLNILPDIVGSGHWSIWIITCLVGIAVGALVGAFQGWLIGYLAIPAFIVTLGGLLVWRGAAWWVTSGQTVAPLDPTFKLLGGGAEGTLGATGSWILAIIAAVVAVVLIFLSRRRKSTHGFAVKPLWAEYVLAGVSVAVILGFAFVMNSYPIPERAAIRMMEARGEVIPEGGPTLVHGIAIPVVILLVIAIAMTVVARRTRFGRYVFATGGNPDAAELSGINTKFLTVKIFALMGALTAVASVIASARLGAVGNDLGTLDELRVIAAAVIGGTALSGGIGTIYGAIIGALIMQSLQSGMAMVGVDAPLQSIVVGVVLVLAVFIDIVYRKRTGG
ncbi:sugar ABC transporter permease [Oceanomicrobium pacificus]|uniref:Xylose transport system permease protein XylH n=1 Tax=Oceanomicrobium pacificus TaxID=2692916 RepID=A0A6B0TJE1_9RHOB|nr:sugar ABC transporter permease [Oceanomicrobium pacificus]MXU64560.1 sugar ABC transporter permease [Oceanomicrobium pacificus]